MLQQSTMQAASLHRDEHIFARRTAAWVVDAVIVGILVMVFSISLLNLTHTSTESLPVQGPLLWLAEFVIGCLESLVCGCILAWIGYLAIQSAVIMLLSGHLHSLEMMFSSENKTIAFVSLAAAYITNLLYRVIFEGCALEATPGKLLFGLKVVRPDGKRIDFRGAEKRHGLKIFSVLSVLVPSIYLLTCNKRQLVHDRLAKTIVVPRTFDPSNRNAFGIAAVQNGDLAAWKTASIPRRIAAAVIDSFAFCALEFLCFSSILWAAARLPAEPFLSLYAKLPQRFHVPLYHGWDVNVLMGIVISFLALPISALFAMLIFSVCESSAMQASPGKYALGTQITDLDGKPLSLLPAFHKQIIQGLLYTGLLPVAYLPIIVFEFMGRNFNSGLYALLVTVAFYAIYGGCLCLSFKQGQTTLDRISKRLVLVRSLPNRMLVLFAVPAFTALSWGFHNQLKSDPYVGAFYYAAHRNLKDSEFSLPHSLHDERTIGSDTYYNTHFGFVDTKGKLAVKPIYDDSRQFHEGMCAVKVKDLWGFIDKTGKLVIPPKFIDVHDFSEGFAAVKESRFIGFLDRNGKYAIVPTTWVDATDFEHGMAAIAIGNKVGVIQYTGEYVVKPELDNTHKFQDGIRRIEKDGHFGFLDADGRLIAEPKYDAVDAFSEGLAPVCLSNKWGYISKTGKLEGKLGFEQAQRFHNGVAVVEINKRFGLIDHQGQWVMKPQFGYITAAYDSPSSTSQLFRGGNMVPICIGNRWGFADGKGEMVIEPQFASVSSFSEGLASVQMFDHPDQVPESAELKWHQSTDQKEQHSLAGRVYLLNGRRTLPKCGIPVWEEIYNALAYHGKKFCTQEREYLKDWLQSHEESGWDYSFDRKKQPVLSERIDHDSHSRRIQKDGDEPFPTLDQIQNALAHNARNYSRTERIFLRKWSQKYEYSGWASGKDEKKELPLAYRVYRDAGETRTDDDSEPHWELVCLALKNHPSDFTSRERTFLIKWSDQNLEGGWDYIRDCAVDTLEYRISVDGGGDSEFDTREDRSQTDRALKNHPGDFNEAERAFLKHWFDNLKRQQQDEATNSDDQS